jgi:hypothetical protein
MEIDVIRRRHTFRLQGRAHLSGCLTEDIKVMKEDDLGKPSL